MHYLSRFQYRPAQLRRGEIKGLFSTLSYIVDFVPPLETGEKRKEKRLKKAGGI